MTLRAVGFHIFAGGFTLGVKDHVNVLCHLESGKFGVETAKENLGIDIYQNEEEWPLEKLKGVDVLYGNPACSGWSVLNVKHRGENSTSNDGIKKFIEIASILRPRVIILESVRSTISKGGPWLRKLAADLTMENYCFQPVFVNAVNHGVAQIRPRVFAVWSRDPILFSNPQLMNEVSVMEAIKDVKDHQDVYEHKHQFMFKHIKQGQSMDQIPIELLEELDHVIAMRRKKNKLFLHWPMRLRVDRPSRVIYSSEKYIHPVEDRLISIGEACRLMGFPDSFKIIGRDKMAQVGKAVSSRVASWLMMEILRNMEG